MKFKDYKLWYINLYPAHWQHCNKVIIKRERERKKKVYFKTTVAIVLLILYVLVYEPSCTI